MHHLEYNLIHHLAAEQFESGVEPSKKRPEDTCESNRVDVSKKHRNDTSLTVNVIRLSDHEYELEKSFIYFTLIDACSKVAT